MRAGCSASTFILVAAWEQSLHPGNPEHRLAHRKRPLNAENAVRTTGLLTAGRNRGAERARLPTVDDQGQQRYFRGTITSRPLDCGLGPLHHGIVDLPGSAPPKQRRLAQLKPAARPVSGWSQVTSPPAVAGRHRPLRPRPAGRCARPRPRVPVSNGLPLCPECGRRRS